MTATGIALIALAANHACSCFQVSDEFRAISNRGIFADRVGARALRFRFARPGLEGEVSCDGHLRARVDRVRRVTIVRTVIAQDELLMVRQAKVRDVYIFKDPVVLDAFMRKFANDGT